MTTLADLQDTVARIDHALERLTPPPAWYVEVEGIDIGRASCITAYVEYTIRQEEGTLVPEVLYCLFDEWVPVTETIRDLAVEAFYEDWRQGRVQFAI